MSSSDLGAGQNAFVRQSHGAGHMLHDGSLIARDDLELDPERRQIGDRLCGIGFGRIGENAKADKCQVGLVR